MNSTGSIGLVLPRQCLVLAGWKKLRENLFAEHAVMFVQARNAGGWIFEGVHASYAVVLLTALPRSDDPIQVAVVTSAAELRDIAPEAVIRFSRDEIASLSDSMVVPWFDDPVDRVVFDKMREFPRLSAEGSWVTGTHDARWDFRGSGPDRGLVVTTETPGAWRVMMTRHVDAFSIRDVPAKQFVNDFAGLAAKTRGVISDAQGAPSFASDHPMVLVRHPSRSDDTRTLIAAALPAEGYLHNKGYIHAVAHAPGTSETVLLALLGLINTNTEDWWARRFVDRHVTAPIVNNLPLPDLTADDIEALAGRTAVLLRNAGYTMLAGGINVLEIADNSPFATKSYEQLRAGSEAVVARGYGLRPDDLDIIRRDFTDRADQGFPAAIFELTCEMLVAGTQVAES